MIKKVADALSAFETLKKYCKQCDDCKECLFWDRGLRRCTFASGLIPEKWMISNIRNWKETEYMIAKTLNNLHPNCLLKRVDGGVIVFSDGEQFTIPNVFFPSMMVGEKVFASEIIEEWEENHDA